CSFFHFPTTPPPELYTLSLHDALPICRVDALRRLHRAGEGDAGDARIGDERRADGLTVADHGNRGVGRDAGLPQDLDRAHADARSEEHTSELQSRGHLVCRLLLEKKKT